ncbi:MAG: hypothetical protein BMS9Abin13_193 [Patescibacteria group bacterium]|nr:MAG: hypothetical protein BMS9Abin13_193 [Patescibacteria group bacterium]
MENKIFNGIKEKTKNLISWSVGLLFLAGITALIIVGGNGDQSKGPTVYSSGTLSAIETSYDFGTIRMEDGDVSHKFEIKNDGSEPVIIERVSTSCICTTAMIYAKDGTEKGPFGMAGHRGANPYANMEVLPSESVVVEAIFDPAAHGPQGVGRVKRIIYIETSSETNHKMELTFEAIVVNQQTI